MKGDSVNLSIAYIARMMLEEQALEYYFALLKPTRLK